DFFSRPRFAVAGLFEAGRRPHIGYEIVELFVREAVFVGRHLNDALLAIALGAAPMDRSAPEDPLLELIRRTHVEAERPIRDERGNRAFDRFRICDAAETVRAVASEAA